MVLRVFFLQLAGRLCRRRKVRQSLLDELHNLLLYNKSVFLHGLAGIGKSELSREYARIHKKDYTNILTLIYRGDLKKDILDLVFTDDIMDEDDERRFERHDQYLRSLKGDTLLIIDNFDTSEDQEPFLPELLAYDCHILFTSRYLWEDYACLGNLSMIPQKGILRIRFAQLADHTSMNQVNDLIEMGIVHEGLDGAIRLHPLIRDLIYSDISPDDIMCEALCNNLRETSSRMGEDLIWYHEVDEIIMNIIRHMKKIRWEYYLHFPQDVFFHADKYDNSEVRKKILNEMKAALKMERS